MSESSGIGDDAGTAPAWLLGERFTAQIIAVYARTFGTASPLASEIRSGGTLDRLAGLSVEDLARLARRAVREMALHEAALADRKPLRPCDWRVILYSLSGARSLREAIARCCDCFEAIDWRCGRMAQRNRGDSVELAVSAARSGASTPAACLVDLFGVTEIHGLFSWLIGRHIPVRAVWLDHDPAIFSGLRLPELPFPLRLAGSWTGFEFDSAFMDYPVLRSLSELVERPANNLLLDPGQRSAGGEASEGQVRRVAFQALREKHRLPGLDAIAAALGTSSATLRRRLTREGASYRQIKVSCRRELALDLLSRTDMSIEEISRRLDFCDSDAFRQSFRQWTGYSPSRHRQLNQT